MATALRRNDQISVWKVEAGKDPSMTTTSKAQEDQVPNETPVAQKPPTERGQLAALGLKRCPSHVRLLDRLPDEVKVPIDGHPVEIRRASDFSKSTSYCKPCDHIQMKDARERAKQHSDTTIASRQRLERKLAKMREQYQELWAQIQSLEQQFPDTQDTKKGK